MSENPNGTTAFRIARLEAQMEELEHELREAVKTVNQKLDRLMMGVVACTLTIAASAIVFTLTTLAGPR